jgi:hypothetical protein
MADITAILLMTCLPAAALVLLATVIISIHREEHRLSLSSWPRAATQRLARRILGVNVSQEYAVRVFSARSAHSPHRGRRPVANLPLVVRGAEGQAGGQAGAGLAVCDVLVLAVLAGGDGPAGQGLGVYTVAEVGEETALGS